MCRRYSSWSRHHREQNIGAVVSLKAKIESTPEARQRVAEAVTKVMMKSPLKAGHKVQHKKTKNVGICLGESDIHKGWYKVQWLNRQKELPYLYELEELEILDG